MSTQSPSSPYQVRKAGPSDVDAICALIKNNPETVLPRSNEEMLELLKSFMVLEYKDSVIGCVCLEVYSPKIAELRSLVVDEKFRGNGLGALLVDAAVQEYKNLGIRQLLVVTSNPDFFSKMNFGPCLNEKYALFWNGQFR